MAITKDAFKTEGLAQQLKQLAGILSTDPDMDKRLRSIIRDVLKEARNELAGDAASGLQMKSDPRQAYRAIRSTVYRQVLGGNVNILAKRKAGSPGPEQLPAVRVGPGGNRRPRSGRTKQLQSYWGSDRGFVLRFLNQGTEGRSINNFIKNAARKVDKWNKHPNTGNRESIQARRWFGDASLRELEVAAEDMAGLIEQLIEERMQ